MLIASPDHLTENFGATLSARGDWLLVGEKFGRAAYLYNRSDAWTTRIRLSPAGIPNTSLTFGPGMGVAVDTDVAVITIRGPNGGAVYIFEQTSPGNWSENTHTIVNFKGGNFSPVALGRDAGGVFLAVLNGGANEENLVSVYRKPSSPGDVWSLAYVLAAASGADLQSIVATDNRIIVGAPGLVLSSGQVGATFVFDATAGAVPLELPVTPLPLGDFGTSLAIDGDHLIVGASGGADGGSAYVFDLSTSSPSPVRLTSPAGTGHYFGRAVGIDQGVAVIGEYFVPPDSTHGYMGGQVWLADAANGWTLRSTPIREHGSGPTGLGYSIGVSGTTVFAGANDFAAGNGGVFVEDEGLAPAWHVPRHVIDQAVAIDPLALLLSTKIYVLLHLPDPPPIDVRKIRSMIARLSPAERRSAFARVEKAHAYSGVLLSELAKR